MTTHSKQFWDSNFSVQSIYKTCNNPRITLLHFIELWNLPIPHKIKCFLWLLLHNRLNTTENLRKKGWPAIENCALCLARLEESAQHLFLDCSYTRIILHRMQGHTPSGIDSLLSAWQLAQRDNRLRSWASTTWEIWKERNTRIFQNENKPPLILLDRINLNIAQWSLAYNRPWPHPRPLLGPTDA
jgi:zinc-binding in reverse transcriptase